MRIGLTLVLAVAWVWVWAASIGIVWCVAMFADSPRLNAAVGRVGRRVTAVALAGPPVGLAMVCRPGWLWLWPVAFAVAAAPAVIVVRAVRRP